MDNKQANRNIRCSVKQCKNHCNTEEYCALESISVGTHESNPTMCECIDCESFEVK